MLGGLVIMTGLDRLPQRAQSACGWRGASLDSCAPLRPNDPRRPAPFTHASGFPPSREHNDGLATRSRVPRTGYAHFLHSVKRNCLTGEKERTCGVCARRIEISE